MLTQGKQTRVWTRMRRADWHVGNYQPIGRWSLVCITEKVFKGSIVNPVTARHELISQSDQFVNFTHVTRSNIGRDFKIAITPKPMVTVSRIAPNALGQATAVGDQSGNNYATEIAYFPNGAASQFTYGNGVNHALVLNGRQMPQQVRDNNVASFEYQYDANGNVTTIYDQQRGVGYNRHMGYDGLDRLVEAGSGQFGGDSWNRYTYDVLDNILSAQLAGVNRPGKLGGCLV